MLIGSSYTCIQIVFEILSISCIIASFSIFLLCILFVSFYSRNRLLLEDYGYKSIFCLILGFFSMIVIVKKSTSSFSNPSCFQTASRHIFLSKYWCGSCSSIVSNGDKYRLSYSIYSFSCSANSCLYFIALD